MVVRLKRLAIVLDIAGIDVQTSANSGENGLWLLDPYDYTIGSIEADYIVEALGGSKQRHDFNGLVN